MSATLRVIRPGLTVEVQTSGRPTLNSLTLIGIDDRAVPIFIILDVAAVRLLRDACYTVLDEEST